ncbi:hypothetical protein AOE01nite_28470 [Acetobacter oeni]|uniref:Nudix hydrolase domain-containing protein n=2 Tax=Acetobacter oeni TaxID=304077 RepID=A0A511XNU3_9PROT|nr:phosphohydrolase [Acetobacter oeni LMG 21952]GEN64623.1 hypothetical protein AOE01nite_28470 [Acetobacter oeni]
MTGGEFGGWTEMKLLPGLTVVTGAAGPAFSDAVEARVTAIWDEAKAARPELFNGRIFSADRLMPGRIGGHWTDYRHALAQMRDPLIFGDRPLRQLAVCGALRCADGFVMARRAASSLYLGGFWQSPPAGTVEARDGDDSVCLADQIAAEAEEELGLTREDLEIGEPLLAVTHTGTHIVDIGIPLRTPLSGDEVRERVSARGNGEYDRIAVISDAERRDWEGRRDVLPTTRKLGRILNCL